MTIKDLEVLKQSIWEDNLPQNFKSTLITCNECKSKVNKEYIHGYDCPVCKTKNIFMSATVKKRYENILERIAKTKRKEKMLLAKKAEKLLKKSQILWHIDKSNLYPFDYEIELEYDSFIDEGYGIPLVIEKKNYIVNNHGLKDFSCPAPFFEIVHEEEKYLNDTHGYCAYFHYDCEYGRTNRTVCVKEDNLITAINEINKFIDNNKEFIKEVIINYLLGIYKKKV